MGCAFALQDHKHNMTNHRIQNKKLNICCRCYFEVSARGIKSSSSSLRGEIESIYLGLFSCQVSRPC